MMQRQGKLEFTIFAGSEAVTATKSSKSAESNCVVVGRTSVGMIALGNSKDTQHPAMVFTQPEWEAFIAGVKTGEFDSTVLN
jgi:hypothetical protein